MKSYKLYLETTTNMRSFLAKHFSEPFDQSALLVFADWLEESGRNDISDLVRHILTGHSAEKSAEWTRQVDQLKNQWMKSLFAKGFQPSSGSLHDFRINNNRYRVFHNEILEFQDSQWRVLPHSEWTEEIVESALYVLFSGLTYHNPDTRDHSDDPRYPDVDPEPMERSGNLAHRQLHQALIRLNHLMARYIQYQGSYSKDDLNSHVKNIHQLLQSSGAKVSSQDLEITRQYISGLVRSNQITPELLSLATDLGIQV